MTQIKLRRDTSANFTSKNPVLGIGEPAYETDTKKLKIGDGSTAYTQLEYFSSGGGGGSVDIAATLPLKIDENGIISLEVDGQTIQIVDGKLHANLDELGNEVNTLAGELAGVQADILNKQDKLTPKLPLKIDVVPGARVFGFTINRQNNQMRADANQEQTMFFGVGQNNAINTNKVHSYIKIPYSVGQILELPYKPTQYFEDPDYANRTAMLPGWFGHTNEDGTVSPVVTVSMKSNWSNSSYDRKATYLYTSFENNAGVYTKKKEIFCSEDLGFNTGSASRPTVFIQINSATNSFDIQFPKGGYLNPDYGNYWTSGTAEFAAADYPTIDCFIYCPPGQESIDTNLFGLYNPEKRLRNEMMWYAEANPNVFSFKGVDTSYLQLDIGSGLAITDGKLTASSTAPTNMVTTDTAQNITGEKTFVGGLTGTGHVVFRDPNSTSQRFEPKWLNNGVELSIFNKDNKDLTFGVNTTNSWFKPFHTCSNFYINNYSDNSAENGIAENVVISGNIKNKLNNVISRVLTQKNVTAGDNIVITETSDGIQISTTELNNPYSLFDSKYSDHELNNLSWLKSEGQWNAKAVYPDAYDELLRGHNSPDRLATFNKDAFEVVGSPTITSDGIASGFSANDYVIIDNPITSSTYTISGTFNTPIPNGTAVIFSTTSPLSLSLRVDTNNNIVLVLFNSAGTQITRTKKCITFDKNTNFKIVADPEIISLYINGSLAISVSAVDIMNVSSSNSIIFGINTPSGSWGVSNGSIDLKQFSITADGVKVFSGAKSKVKLSTETYTDYDYVINTTDGTFRLPLLNGSENLPSNTIVSRANNTVINAGETKTLFTASHNGNISIKVFSTTGGNTITVFRNNVFVGGAGFPNNAYNQSTISFDVKRGDVVVVNLDQGTATYNYMYSKAVGNGPLYYYIGETVQNANLIDAGRLGEELVDVKASIDGDWTYKVLQFASSVSIPINTEGTGNVFTYDLSNYLPNDGYKYEVTISVEVNDSSFCTLGYYLPDNSWYSFAKGGNPTGGCFNAIVDPSKQLKISVVNTQAGLMWARAVAYRRLGKKV